MDLRSTFFLFEALEDPKTDNHNRRHNFHDDPWNDMWS